MGDNTKKIKYKNRIKRLKHQLSDSNLFYYDSTFNLKNLTKYITQGLSNRPKDRPFTFQIGYFQLTVEPFATIHEFEEAYKETILRNEHYKDQSNKVNWIPFEDWKKLINIKDKLAAYGL